MNVPNIKSLFLRSFRQFGEDRVPRLAAALTFFALLSLAPMLVLAVAAAGIFLAEDSVRREIESQIARAIGPSVSELIGSIIESAGQMGTGIVASVLGLGVALFAASNLFNQLSEAANSIWGVKPAAGGIKRLILARVFAVVLVFAFMILVLAWIILDSWLSWLGRQTPGFAAWPLVSMVVSILFLTLVFGASFKALPKGMVAWKDVWLGAGVTAVALAITKYLLGLYFGFAGVGSAYGPAGAVVLVLLWIYYMSQIYFFGMELTYSYAHSLGSRMGREKLELQHS
jgi:membrane protein